MVKRFVEHCNDSFVQGSIVSNASNYVLCQNKEIKKLIITSLEALNHFCKVSHLFGQNFAAPATELHSLNACSPVSLAGNGSLLKYMSWDVMLVLNSFTAALVSCFPVILFASESICVPKVTNSKL